MRIIAIAVACTLAAASAQAQDVQRIKATGANAVGICAGALDMLGQYVSRADNPDPQKLARIAQARNFFADMPQYSQADIAAAANAFVTLMSNRIVKAPTVEERQAVQREIVEVANGCQKSIVTALRSTQGTLPSGTIQGGTVIAPPVTVQPLTTQPLDTQPLLTQPLNTEPLILQPYETQPLVLDPVVPAQ